MHYAALQRRCEYAYFPSPGLAQDGKKMGKWLIIVLFHEAFSASQKCHPSVCVALISIAFGVEKL